MKTRFGIGFGWLTLPILLSASGWALCAYASRFGGAEPDVFLTLYKESARTPLFTAFFTMGSFLLTLKTTILARIKETYETQSYRDVFREKRLANPSVKYFSQLENLGGALGLSVILCLLAACVQLTLGFWWNPIAFGLCTGIAATALMLLIRLTVEIAAAHRDWFNKIEEDAQDLMRNLDTANSLPTSDISSAGQDGNHLALLLGLAKLLREKGALPEEQNDKK